MFTLSESGRALLLDGPVWEVVRVTAITALGLGAIAVALGGTAGRALCLAERAAVFVGGLLLLVPDWRTVGAGLSLLAVVALAMSLHRPAVTQD